MVAINLGRRYGIPTVALRYSIVQGPRQSVYNAYSGACRIFCLSYLQGVAPTLYEDGGAIRDYVNIDDVVDANVLVLADDRAAGRVFNVGGGQAVTTREFADIVMRQYGSAQPGAVTGEYRFGDTRHILSDISALRALGWEAAAHAGRLGRGVRRLAQGHGRSRRGAGRGERADARPRGGPEDRGVKAFLLAAGVGSRLRPITDTIPKCMVAIDGRPLLDIWLDAFDRAGVDEVLVNLHHLPDVVRDHIAARTGPPVVRTFFEPELLGSAGTLAANRDWVDGEEMFLACNADNLTDFDLRSLIDAHREHDAIATLTVFHSETPSAGGVVEVDGDGTVVGFVEKPAEPVSDLTNAGMYAFHPSVLDEIDRADAERHRLSPAAAAGGPGAGRAGGGVLPRHRHGRSVPASQGGVARAGRTMIITQTPLRIGLLGGGTDLPGYYREHGGRVLNCAIDKYVYVIVKQRFDDDIYVNYSKKEIVSRVDDLEHELVREAMHMAGVANGVEITTLADIPSGGGSGLGSSSAVTVGLLQALFAYQGRQVSAEELAERACTIEIERCRKPIGKQDQYIAALGGIRDIRFGPGDEVVAAGTGAVRGSAAGRSSSRSCCFTPA